MSLAEIDFMPRLRDTLSPDDLDLGACVNLAGYVLQEAAAEYVAARRALHREPFNKSAREHLKQLRIFYGSDYFKALSCGMVEGSAVMRELDKRI